jgi:hypothetical protein
MGTRCGALDPGVVIYLIRAYGMGADAVERMLYHDCGLKAMSGISNDMRPLLASDDPRPARCLVTIEDVGYAVAGPATDAAKLITGDTVYIDGGYHSCLLSGTWVEPVIEAEIAYSTLTENKLLREAVFKACARTWSRRQRLGLAHLHRLSAERPRHGGHRYVVAAGAARIPDCGPCDLAPGRERNSFGRIYGGAAAAQITRQVPTSLRRPGRPSAAREIACTYAERPRPVPFNTIRELHEW